MIDNPFTAHLTRVGVLAITGSESLLDDVGQSAWQRIGGVSIEESLPANCYVLTRMLVLPRGEREEIATILSDWCDAPNPEYRCHVIVTVGGDGFRPEHNLPEATRSVIEAEAPGLAERLRQAYVDSASDGPQAASARVGLTRGIAGARKKTLIVNLPSCFETPGDAIRALLPLLPDVMDALSSGQSPSSPAPTAALKMA